MLVNLPKIHSVLGFVHNFLNQPENTLIWWQIPRYSDGYISVLFLQFNRKMSKGAPNNNFIELEAKIKEF